MRRLLPRLFALTAAVSAVLCAAVCWAWRQSGRGQYSVSGVTRAGGGLELNTSMAGATASGGGRGGITWYRYRGGPPHDGTGVQFYACDPYQCGKEQALAEWTASGPGPGFARADALTWDE